MNCRSLVDKSVLLGFATADPASVIEDDSLAENFQAYTALSQEIAPRRLSRYQSALTPSKIAAQSARNSLKRAGLQLQDVDFVLSCSQTPDFNNPGLVSCLIAELGLSGVPALEIRQLNCGAIYAMDLADKLVRLGQAQAVLVSCTDLLSRYFGECPDYGCVSEIDQARAVFGDGSAAFLVLHPDLYSKELRDRGFAYQLHSTLAATSAIAESKFYGPLPSARQVPLRLRLEDVTAGTYLPRLNSAGFLSESREFYQQHFKKFIETSGIISVKQQIQLVTHQIFKGMHSQLAIGNIVESNAIDVFDDFGFVASAGIPLAMIALENEGLSKENRSKLHLLTALSAGPAAAFSLLERI